MCRVGAILTMGDMLQFMLDATVHAYLAAAAK